MLVLKKKYKNEFIFFIVAITFILNIRCGEDNSTKCSPESMLIMNNKESARKVELLSKEDLSNVKSLITSASISKIDYKKLISISKSNLKLSKITPENGVVLKKLGQVKSKKKNRERRLMISDSFNIKASDNNIRKGRRR